jgi:hypothetical protein
LRAARAGHGAREETGIENLGMLLPWWLLGAPLLAAIVDWMRTPRGDAATHR